MRINLYNEDCLIGMKRIPDASVDCVLTYPPYLYLKNQKLDRSFDEQAFFAEVKRILKKDGFIVMFGRGTSFYRWNTILADLGFNFKEEIIWDKSYISSPLMAISRVHETVSIYTKGKGTINRCKVPYLEAKAHNIDSIIADIKRLCTIFHNPKSLKAVEDFLTQNKLKYEPDKRRRCHVTAQTGFGSEDRNAAVMRAMSDGYTEKSIIRSDLYKCSTSNKHNFHGDMRVGDRSCNVMQSVEFGQSEKSIIKQPRDHYATIHPTQKPVRLLERLLALVTKEGDIILDPFAGSASTAIACMDTGRDFIGYEIDKEYYVRAMGRISKHQPKLGLQTA